MSEPRTRNFTLPEGFVPRDRGAIAPTDPIANTRGEDTGEPRPTLGWGFWPKVLGLAVLALLGIVFLATNDFSLSAIALMIVVVLLAGGLLTLVYFIAKANKKDDDHSNPKQGPDKVEDHRGH